MDSTIAFCLENDTIVRKNRHKYGRDTEKLKVLKGNLTIPNSSLLQLATNHNSHCKYGDEKKIIFHRITTDSSVSSLENHGLSDC